MRVKLGIVYSVVRNQVYLTPEFFGGTRAFAITVDNNKIYLTPQEDFCVLCGAFARDLLPHRGNYVCRTCRKAMYETLLRHDEAKKRMWDRNSQRNYQSRKRME